MSDVAPWRALEETPAGNGDGPSKAAKAASPGGIAGSTWVVVAHAAAVIVAGIAIWLVASSGHGSLVVEGAGAAPGRSDAAAGPDGRGSSARPGATRIVIDVQGAVARPGIVELAQGSRVADAIVAAGGYGPRVAAGRVGQVLNLAAFVKDGDQVVVPSRDDPATQATAPARGGGGAGGGDGAGTSRPVDLNRATVAELDELPGIGPVTAAKIVAAREEQPFATVDDLRSRKILGAATFDKVKDLVVVR